MHSRKRFLSVVCAVFILGFSVSVLASSPAAAQQSARGVGVSINVGTTSLSLYSESHALVIGASAYRSWPSLPGVRKDVEQIKTALQAQGFDTRVVSDPTRGALEQALRDFVADYGQIVEARLLVYFAGHGHTLTTADGRQLGYIVPVDAPRPARDQVGAFKRMAVSMTDIENIALQIESKHVLFIFDSCFSGSIFEATRAIPDDITEKTARPVRQFITAGDADQTVPDNSIFLAEFIEGISGEADTNDDGYVTGSELGEHLQSKVTNYSRRAQTPQYGKLSRRGLDRGDFVFAIKNREPPSLPASVSSNADSRTIELALWDSVKNSADPELFRDYLRRFPNGVFSTVARSRVAALSQPSPLAAQPIGTAPPPTGSQTQMGSPNPANVGLLLSAAEESRLRLLLRKLTVLGSALYIGAHPDDENTPLISYLASESLFRTAYLSMTRGENGQNLLGPEKGDVLGVIRTEEQRAARQIDGAEQYFTRARDFGYSRSPEETFATWGRTSLLADVVWVIRRLQPDVIVTRFPTTGEGGHGHHTASAILALDAFRAAADPAQFPEQLKYVRPWAPKRLLWNRFGHAATPDSSLAELPRVDLATFNTTLGKTYTEIAFESRGLHKSQGIGPTERKGPVLNHFVLIAGDEAYGITDGIDTSWSRYDGGNGVGNLLQRASESFDPKDTSGTIDLLLRAWEALHQLEKRPAWAHIRNPWISIKRKELLEAIRLCAGLSLEARGSASYVTPGGALPIVVRVVQRSDAPFLLKSVKSPFQSALSSVEKSLHKSIPVTVDVLAQMPDHQHPSHPYWLRRPSSEGLFQVSEQELIGSIGEPDIAVQIVISVGHDHELTFDVPVQFVENGAAGVRLRQVDVAPRITSTMAPLMVFPNAKGKPISVTIRNFGGPTEGTLRLIAPQGWLVEPQALPFVFRNDDGEKRSVFTITPPAEEGTGALRAEVEVAGVRSGYGLLEIDYPHLPPIRLFPASEAKLVRVDVTRRGSRIGYIMGAGDEVPDALRQIGFDVTLLTDADLARAHFSQFDAVIAGVRAYNTRTALKDAHARLIDYVKNGGTFVVQYSAPQGAIVEALGPYPFQLSTDRVTMENSPVQIDKPWHSLWSAPNRILSSSFDGWVQERGLYFAKEWDSRYETMVTMGDPATPPLTGGQLYTRYGNGVFIYTGLAWFRQLPAGVSGAFKLFANLISAK